MSQFARAAKAALDVAGVDVCQILVPGMLHGFLNLHAGSEPVHEALELMADVVAA